MLNKSSRFGPVVTVLVMLGFYGMVLYRSAIVEARVSQIQNCDGCYQSWVLISDGWLALVLVGLIGVGIWGAWFSIRLLARFTVLIFLLMYFVDLQLFDHLTARLFYYDIATYFDVNAISFWATESLGYWLIPLLCLFFFGCFLFLFKHHRAPVNSIWLSMLVMPILIWGYLLLSTKPIKYVHDVYIRNFVSINLQMGEATEYSSEYVAVAKTKIKDIERLQCAVGLNQQPNIILVVLESFSFYQSQLLSGIKDWTPKLDKLAQEYTYFDQFYANNFNSLGGRLALFTGEKTFRHVAPFLTVLREGYYNTQRNLPTVLNDKGYLTSFLDAADLGFTETGMFMDGLGFDFVEGHESTFYQDHPRFAYSSVADDVLYNRVLAYNKSTAEPFFNTVITVSTHHPYLDPVSREPNIEAVVKYADQALYDFYMGLKAQGFFDNGLLILTSDHRSMTPLFEQELTKMGDQALAKIPLVLIGEKYKGGGLDSALTQQSDLLNSIEYLISPQHCYRKGEGNMLSQPAKSAECVYHNRGDYRDRIDVYCDGGETYGQVRLDGDDTQLIKGSIPNEQEVIDYINVSRVAIKERHIEHQNQ